MATSPAPLKHPLKLVINNKHKNAKRIQKIETNVKYQFANVAVMDKNEENDDSNTFEELEANRANQVLNHTKLSFALGFLAAWLLFSHPTHGVFGWGFKIVLPLALFMVASLLNKARLHIEFPGKEII